MTIDEAIEHAEETACGNDQCANDHAQLANWLRELRRARMEIDLLKTLRDGFKADAQKYKAENAKLREKCNTYRDLVGCMVHPDIPDQLAAENAKLRDSLQDFYDVACAFYRGIGTEDDLRDLSRQMRELGIGVSE